MELEQRRCRAGGSPRASEGPAAGFSGVWPARRAASLCIFSRGMGRGVETAGADTVGTDRLRAFGGNHINF